MENNTQPQNQLTVADMASVLSVIELACARGAFRANEMSVLGPVYDRLKAFVDATNAMAQQPTPEPASADKQDQGESNA